MKGWRSGIFFAGLGSALAAPPPDVAEALYRSAHYREAEVAFAQLADADNNNANARYYLGKISVRLGNYASAIDRLEQSVQLAPNNSSYRLWLGNAYAWAASIAPLGEKSALGRKCLEAYRKAIDLDGDNLRAHFSLMNFYRHVPSLFGGGLDKAYREAEAIRQRDPNQGALAVATLNLQERKYPAAFTLLVGLLKKNPADYSANCALGRLGLESGTHLEEAAAAFNRCLTLCPSENDEGLEFAQWGCGQIAEMKHEAVAARRAYEVCLQLNPSYKPAIEALARLR